MKQLLAGRMVLCDHCGLAFVVNEEGDVKCQPCIDARENENEIINSGELMDFSYDNE